MHIQSDICIIGDGAIGKVAALGFAQAGLKVSLLSPSRVVASAPASTAVPQAWDARVYAVNHVAHDLLSGVKVWEALDASRVAAVDAMVVKGDTASVLAFDAYGARVGALAWIVEDRNLNQALDAALKFASNVRMVHGRALSLQANAAAASVQLDNGDTLSAELLVGADGGQSWVRTQCEIDFDYRPYGQRAIVSNFACEKPHHGVAHQWFSPAEGIIALLPLPGNQVSLVWSAPDALADVLLQESLAQLAARLSILAAEQLGSLSPLQPEIVKSFPLALIRPHSITAARVALIGDAAHVVHPLAGHGMNLGFADVAGLIKAVSERGADRDCGDARVLSRYARSRKEDILLMQLATDGLARLFGTEFEPLRIARNFGLNLVNRLPVLKRRLIGHALGKP
ncbi:Putative Ubiquinone biosynthesis hydroxylase VisC [Herminiimonas arsenicoxydans]|uniref:Ubiquinone biosynthesis hydroxylase VisC n=1 Tax=Herminiimonas arsenicoxydans TaxID=204773 RepID=A4G1P1_HERAR|nr:Putative Ubiquinone biosynthesis hydroxylase VisC [Herminiimonas arsenicoxydans]